MTSINKKSPVPAATGNEGNESIAEHSTATAYLAYPADSTRHSYGTWSGTDLPRKGHIALIVPLDAAQRMYADGPQLIDLNTACTDAHTRKHRKQQEEKRAKQRQQLMRWITEEIEEEHWEQIADLDDQYTELYKRIDAQAEARFRAEHPEVD